MPAEQNITPVTAVTTSLLGWFGPAMDYMVDATQRNVLFWDVMRQRGNQYRDHLAETVPHVLEYEVMSAVRVVAGELMAAVRLL